MKIYKEDEEGNEFKEKIQIKGDCGCLLYLEDQNNQLSTENDLLKRKLDENSPKILEYQTILEKCKRLEKENKNLAENNNILKEQFNEGKNRKLDAEQNCDNLKQEFYDRFLIIENYEKQIKLLDEEKQEIIKTNTEIIEMKGQQTYDLQRQLNKVQEETNAQREVINDLNGKIAVLEEKI